MGVDRDSKRPDADTVILFDDGEVMFGVQRGYWFRDEDDDTHKTHKLGLRRALEQKLSKGHRCGQCGHEFQNEESLERHKSSGWCRKTEKMDSKQLRRLHRTRQTSSTRRGKGAESVEQVKVVTCDGKLTKRCGSFVYLGTLTNMDASATPEVRRRIGMALGAFGSLGKIWKSKAISRKTKSRLYTAIILSLMLYNAEIWNIKKQDLAALEGAHFRMIRSMMNVGDELHFTKQELLQKFDLPRLADYITQKRMRWIGHALRRDDRDRSKIAVIKTLKDEHSFWTKLAKEDCKKLRNIPWRKLRRLATNRDLFSKFTHWRTINS